MCMLHGLAKMPHEEFEAIHIAAKYRMWYLDGPFDIGNTTKSGF